MFLIGFNQNEKEKKPEIKLSKNARHDPTKDAASIRIIVCGPKGSGKTALIYRFTKDSFNSSLKALSFDHDRTGLSKEHMCIAQEEKPIKLNIYDLSHTITNYQEIIKSSPDAKDTVVFVVCNIHRKKTSAEIIKDIGEQCNSLKAKFENCKIVLVGTKSDKKIETDPLILKGVAEQLGCIGSAIVSAKTPTNVDLLFKTTIESIMATKENRLSTTLLLPPEVKYPGVESINTGEVSEVAEKAKDDTTQVNNAEIIERLESQITLLEKEILSTFAANKDRKLIKKRALEELVFLIQYFPGIELARHIQTIRNKYGDKGLEAPRETSRVKQLLDSLLADKNKPRIELRSLV